MIRTFDTIATYWLSWLMFSFLLGMAGATLLIYTRWFRPGGWKRLRTSAVILLIQAVVSGLVMVLFQWAIVAGAREEVKTFLSQPGLTVMVNGFPVDSSNAQAVLASLKTMHPVTGRKGQYPTLKTIIRVSSAGKSLVLSAELDSRDEHMYWIFWRNSSYRQLKSREIGRIRSDLFRNVRYDR